MNLKKRRTFLFADKTDLKSTKKILQKEWFWRFSRLSSRYADFLIRSKSLVDKLKTQGYKIIDLKRLTSRFFKEKHDILVKYNIPNTDDFFQNIFA